MTEQAFLRELDTIRPKLRQYVRKLMRGADAADDLTQDVVIKLWRHCARLDYDGMFAYACKIARTTVIDHRRGISRRVKTTRLDDLAGDDFADAEHLLVDQSLSVEDAVIAEVVVEEFLERALPQDADLLRQEMAGRAGTSSSTQNTRLCRARARVKNLILGGQLVA